MSTSSLPIERHPDVLEMHDNTELLSGELTGPSLYVVARMETR